MLTPVARTSDVINKSVEKKLLSKVGGMAELCESVAVIRSSHWEYCPSFQTCE